MELEDLTPGKPKGTPPLMPWREFANWIHMGDEHNTVWGWIRNDYIPSRKVGKHVMVNVALLTTQLLEQEWFQ